MDVSCIFAAIKAHSTKNTSSVAILPPSTSRRFVEGIEDVMMSVLLRWLMISYATYGVVRETKKVYICTIIESQFTSREERTERRSGKEDSGEASA